MSDECSMTFADLMGDLRARLRARHRKLASPHEAWGLLKTLVERFLDDACKVSPCRTGVALSVLVDIACRAEQAAAETMMPIGPFDHWRRMATRRRGAQRDRGFASPYEGYAALVLLSNRLLEQISGKAEIDAVMTLAELATVAEEIATDLGWVVSEAKKGDAA